MRVRGPSARLLLEAVVSATSCRPGCLRGYHNRPTLLPRDAAPPRHHLQLRAPLPSPVASPSPPPPHWVPLSPPSCAPPSASPPSLSPSLSSSSRCSPRSSPPSRPRPPPKSLPPGPQSAPRLCGACWGGAQRRDRPRQWRQQPWRRCRSRRAQWSSCGQRWAGWSRGVTPSPRHCRWGTHAASGRLGGRERCRESVENASRERGGLHFMLPYAYFPAGLDVVVKTVCCVLRGA